MSKIEEAIEDIINGHLSGMDFSDMITTEVRECWDMDELDRIDDIADAVENLENNLDSATLENMDQKIDQLTEYVDSSIKNLIEHTNQLQMRIRDLEDRLNDYEEIREMAWQSANKSFFQKLMFWR